MRLRTKHGLQTLRRAHHFLVSRDYSLALGELGPHAAALSALVVRLQQHAIAQDNHTQGARAATDRKNALGWTLRQEYLRPIAEMARTMFVDDPKIREAYQLPTGRDDGGLLQGANGFVARGTDHASQFASRGLASDFVQRLRAATDAFQDALLVQGTEVASRAAATAGSDTELSRGRDLVRLIDMMLAPRLVHMPDQLAEWQSIKRFVRRGGVEGGGGAVKSSVEHSPASADSSTPTAGPVAGPSAPTVGGTTTNPPLPAVGAA